MSALRQPMRISDVVLALNDVLSREGDLPVLLEARLSGGLGSVSAYEVVLAQNAGGAVVIIADIRGVST